MMTLSKFLINKVSQVRQYAVSARNGMIQNILLVALLSACAKVDQTYSEPLSEIGPLGEQAMVASAHPLATKVGVAVLKDGGNAFDAALAVKFALAVVFPRAGNIGGGGFALYRLSDGSVGSLDFREKAPKSAQVHMFLDEQGNVLPEKSIIGHLAAGVPGTVDGILRLHDSLGSRSIGELMEPAIRIAQEGFAITQDQADIFNEKQQDLIRVNGSDFFMVKPGGWQMGDSIKFPELGETLQSISFHGRRGFYTGRVAEMIVAEMNGGDGRITLDDLKSYKSKWRQPLVGSYKGHQIISMPPPSSGGIALLQLLQGAESYPLGEMQHNSGPTIHLMTELERRVYADRATHLGDPDFYEVPVAMLLDPTYNKTRFADIKPDQKTDSQLIKEGNVEIIESVETTHFSVVDAFGNAVAITTTLNSFFGCKVYVQGAGFFLNNEMDDFSAKPGAPNQFGLVGGLANAIAPEKRMLSSMTPTIVAKDGRLKMVVGTPGGSTIITSVFQTILNVIDHGMGMQDAVNATRVHSQWLPDRILVEKRWLPAGTLEELKTLGHTIEFRNSMGRMDCILVRPDGRLEGGSDHMRGDNYAEGF
ncbi:MAG: gamma-glutamyltransferase [Bacteroidota bacterium]